MPVSDTPEREKARRKCRLIAWLFPLGSLGVLLGALAVTSRASVSQFLAALGSPAILLLLGLLSLIYLPASVRIYYICLLKTTGVFTAAQRKAHQAGKEKWDKHLLRGGLIAGIFTILLVILRIAAK